MLLFPQKLLDQNIYKATFQTIRGSRGKKSTNTVTRGVLNKSSEFIFLYIENIFVEKEIIFINSGISYELV